MVGCGGGYGQGPQLSMTGTDGVTPVRACGALSGAIVCNSVQDQGAISCSLDSTQLGTQCEVVQSVTTQCVKAGEGDRTLDIQLGNASNLCEHTYYSSDGISLQSSWYYPNLRRTFPDHRLFDRLIG